MDDADRPGELSRADAPGGVVAAPSLRFIGRGSAFADEHNCAWFRVGGSLVLIDCPASAYARMRDMALGYERVFVLVTHTHADHVGGLSLMSEYLYCRSGGELVPDIVAPTPEVAHDLRTLLAVEGTPPGWYRMWHAGRGGVGVRRLDFSGLGWSASPVEVDHVPELRCYGYVLDIGGRRVVYTGDASSPAPLLAHVTPGCELYSEISAWDSPVHYCCARAVPELSALVRDGVQVYVMHIDDEDRIADAIAGTGIGKAPLGLPPCLR